MSVNFKKLGTAAAVSAALGAPAISSAITLGVPGEGVLVPYAIYEDATGTNTMVGLTSATGGDFHWVFFNTRSEHMEDGSFDMTANDVFGFDYRSVITDAQATAYDGVPGYLVFTQQELYEGNSDDGSTLYGDAAIITGNWSSASFVPAVPLAAGEIAATGVVTNPANGTPLGDFSLRYNVGSLGQATDMVIWKDANDDGGTFTVYVYDTDQVANSTNLALPDELNVVDASDIGWVNSKGAGFVHFLNGAHHPGATDAAGANGVAFSMMYINNAGDAQTTLAQER